MRLSTAAATFLRDAAVHLTRQTLVNYQSDLNLLVALATFHRADSVLSEEYNAMDESECPYCNEDGEPEDEEDA